MVCKVTPKATPTRGSANEHGPESHELADYETALDSAGYGNFSRCALVGCAGAFFTTGVENCIMSYVLPAARCELQLTTYHAGLVNMAFMSGGVASAFFWGIVGDVFGRRRCLSMTLILNGLLTLAQSFVIDYRLLLAARSINGFLIGCPSTIVFPYLSDLVGAKRRQFYLNITGMSFVAAWIILPAIAWLVIPFRVADHSILPTHSWRLYTAIGSIPGFLFGCWVLFLPESPRLLSDTNRSEEALNLLAGIYKRNRGHGEYKIKRLIQDNVLVSKSLNTEENRTKALFIGVLKDLKVFVSMSYALKSSLILFMFFANMAAGFGLNLWIPELLLRVQGRDCSLSKKVAAHSGVISPEVCDENMDMEVFISGLIVGACCVLGNAACAVTCARTEGAKGVRRAAAACALTTALACACLAACACSCAASSKLAVAAAAALNSASLNGNVLLIRLLLHALPAKLSGLGVCWGAWWGRAGGVATNLAVGVLLDYSCPAPFITVAALLAASVVAIMMLKLEDNQEEILPEDKTDPPSRIEKNYGLDRYISTHM